ncbi:receptor-like serine/threonine-protein kinase SD1-7 isoform X2 [Zingiber officinale]|uniref:receptor-like serine/threonine-protein kinase SD1-7 isoform X2 n=1 Tax=Zingiber officinale TaxID=94328 RepID=UPI001C4BD74B|nr:receptor-like serine/threonine-protein kinase SD1-7 isoform X2 [Zingiber officinale]
MKLFPSHLLKIVAVTLFFLAPSSSSGDHLFRLGFFSLDNSSANGYLGIWYCNLTPQEGTVVWIANRNKPVNKSMASFNFTSDGNLILFEEDRNVWSTETRSTGLNSARLQLLDSGNLVLNDSYSILWQSFEHPNDSDTYLPGMKLGFNSRTNTSWREVSWKNSADPSPGDYIKLIRALPIPDLVIFNRSAKYHRSGLWNGNEFVGHPSMANSQVAINFTFVSNENETYYMANYTAPPKPVLSRTVLCHNGTSQRWFLGTGEWQLLWSIPEDVCDMYNYCGRNKMCTKKYNGPVCQCLPGFVKIEENGCQSEKPLNCSSNQFSAVHNVKVPDTENATARGNISLDDCKNFCLDDCSCVAYAVISAPYGCITWTGDLLDLRTFDDEGLDDLYIRLAGNLNIDSNGSTRKHAWAAIAIPLLLGFFLLCCVGLLMWRKRNRASTGLLLQLPNLKEGDSMTRDDGSESRLVSIDSEDSRDLHNTDKGVGMLNTLGLLPSYDFCTIKNATNNFSDGNKLGEGGFGVVYKGQLEDGQRIAVKKLSRNSSQGPNEFQNELSLIAKLQHRNLVRLLGCCIEGAERLIVLEYMENKSLDAFIYDKTKSSLLDWQKRLDIIIGIARGLLYLHQDSILRVIHRDLKPSNILLDRDMTPKISDFGIARIAEGDRDLADGTTRPIGTFGYMAPEYLSCGYFSFKSDVFSFGVIVLEILSGKRNRTFGQANSGLNLLQHTYRLWKEGRSLNILDDAVSCSYPTIKILRCIRMALLCVQDNYENRPTMTEVVMILTSEDHLIPLKQPIITSTRSDGDYTTKEMSITITGR